MKRWPYWELAGISSNRWSGKNLWISRNEGNYPNFLIVLRWGWLPVGFYFAVAPCIRGHYFSPLTRDSRRFHQFDAIYED